MMRIGLVSDTHGRFDPTLPRLFERCERILHAGDIVGTEILTLLQAFAPVTAVRGNCDTGEWGSGLEEEAVLRLEDLVVLVLHHLGTPERPAPAARAALERSRAQLVVFGHSHQPGVWLHQGRLFVNPGSAGPRRFELPRSAGVLELRGRRARVELFDLERPGQPLLQEPFEVALAPL